MLLLLCILIFFIARPLLHNGYSNYTHVLHSLMEAENFAGSSIVLAYLPLAAAQTDTISIMKNSKVAVDMYVANFIYYYSLYSEVYGLCTVGIPHSNKLVKLSRWNPKELKQN